MALTMSGFRGILLIYLSLSANSVQSSEAILDQHSDTSIVTKIINYVRPYIHSLQLGPKTSAEPTLETIINEKIKELQPYLQDNDGEKLELEGDEETTIIEFTPRAIKNKNHSKYIDNDTSADSLEVNLRKYKIMRNKIKIALDREAVSKETKQFVTKTLDKIIAKLADSQCPRRMFYNSNIEKMLGSRREVHDNLLSNVYFANDSSCYMGNVKLDDGLCHLFREPYKHCFIDKVKVSEEQCKKILDIAAMNNTCVVKGKKISFDECQKISGVILEKINNIVNDLFKKEKLGYLEKLFPTKPKKILAFYKTFNQIVSNVLRHANSISDKYEVKCTIVNTDKGRKNNLRQKDICQNFRVCSEELKEFLKVFYKSLNDTAVLTFRNYAAMYERDIVGDESEEKNSVMFAIKQASDSVERRVANVFMKTTSTLTLDHNKDRETNVAALRQFVIHTVKNVNKTIVKHMEEDLKSLRARLLLAITVDLQHNLASQLAIFESDVVGQICSFFITCKGNTNVYKEGTNRKQFAPKRKFNSIFANVELTLDDDFKNIIVDKHKEVMRERNVIEMRSQYVNPVNETNRNNIKVTRTTTGTQKTKTNSPIIALDTTVTEDSYETDSDFENTNIFNT